MISAQSISAHQLNSQSNENMSSNDNILQDRKNLQSRFESNEHPVHYGNLKKKKKKGKKSV